MIRGKQLQWKRMTEILLKPSSICLGIVLAAGSIGAHAQSSSTEPSGQIEEIIITAEFRATNVQDTPVAITAVTGEMLDNRAQTNLFQVANQAPNVTLKEGGQASVRHDCLHPRRRPVRLYCRTGTGCGRLRGRRLLRAAHRLTARAPGRGPGRGPAWTTGHAVRPKLDRWRGQAVHEKARRRQRRFRPGGSRFL